VALSTLQQLVSLFPASFSDSVRSCIVSGTLFDLIPQDVTLIDNPAIITLAGVNLILASPDCQPFSFAGNQNGFSDSRSASFRHCLRIIRSIYDLTLQPVTYVVENVPGAGRYRSIIDALGLPLKISAHLLGSVARRETLIWTNAHTREFLLSHLTASLVPPPTVGEFLIQHGFHKDWAAAVPLAHTVFPKFLSRLGSHAYRMHGDKPGRGMLQYHDQWAEPNCDIRAVAMGFPRDHLQAADITEPVRHRLLGSCIDGNILAWLADALCA
jgi:hypothetical protein